MVKLLVVDDEGEILDVIAEELDGLHKVHPASNSDEAFAVLGEQTIDALLCDVDLADSELQGDELMAVVQADYPGVTIVAMTGGVSQNLPFIMHAGVRHVLRKPFSRNALISIIDEALGIHRDTVSV
ncbi:MAG: response regulator [Patescibacteria group bacterium]